MAQAKWTTEQIPDQSGKVAIVTGGNSGLGYESVKALAQKGATVVMASRSIERGNQAKEEIVAEGISGSIEVVELNLMSLESIKKFAASIHATYQKIDILLNNAGIMTTPYGLTEDGFEQQLGTNHLGHFALTGLLIDLIKNTPNARVVTTSSMAHKNGKMQFNNLLFKDGKDYSPMKAYGQSKLANLLFAYELQSLFEQHQINAISVAAHPGVSTTNLGRHIEDKLWFKLIVKPLIPVLTHAPDKGALPQLMAATDSGVKGADYYGPNGFNEMKGDPAKCTSTKASHNKADAQRLWESSEKLTGVVYDFSK